MAKDTVVGVGAALVDLLIEESDAFIEKMGSPKGGMTLVPQGRIEEALAATSSDMRIVPGGSACNTLVGLGHLGARARMVGRIGQDRLATDFETGLKKAGVEGRLLPSGTPTGRVLSVVTPDAQRTMFTYLGASSELKPADIRAEHFDGAALVLLEGYLLFNEPVVERILALARGAGARIALDLASFQVVEACRPLLDRIIPESIDILLANEDEAKAFCGYGGAEALDVFTALTDTAVVKLGAEGVAVGREDERFRIAARKVEAVDTTGAGDLWASGFLYGLLHDYSLSQAAKLGCEVGAEVVQVMGASIPLEGWRRIEQFRASLPKR